VRDPQPPKGSQLEANKKAMNIQVRAVLDSDSPLLPPLLPRRPICRPMPLLLEGIFALTDEGFHGLPASFSPGFNN